MAKRKEYRDNFEQLPPVKVWRLFGHPQLWLIDGRSRIWAARKLGMREIAAIVVGQGTEIEMRKEAFRANFDHGFPLSPDEKWKAIRDLSASDPKMTQDELAVWFHVNQSTVSRALSTVKSGRNYARCIKSGWALFRDLASKARSAVQQELEANPFSSWSEELKAERKAELETLLAIYRELYGTEGSA